MNTYDPTRLSPSAKSGMLAVAGTRLHYVEAGSGRALLLVGGWPQSVHLWRHLFAPLAARYRVIAIDPPGLGDSAKPAPCYDIEGVARIVWSAVDALAIDRLDIVGFDIGMWLGYSMALQQAARVRSLTLIDAVIPGLVPWPPFNPAAANRTWHFAFNLLPGLAETLIEGREREFLKWLFESRTPTPGVFSEADFDEYARVYRGRDAIASALGYYRALPATIAQVEKLVSAPPLPMPVLAVSGAAGVGASMIEAVRRIAANVTGQVIEGCGHYVPEEAPRALLELLNEHIEKAT